MALADIDPTQPLGKMAKLGEATFDKVAAERGETTAGMTSATQSNPLQFKSLIDFWCAYDLTDRIRKPALLIDDMQVEYAPYVHGIVPQVKLLLSVFREAGLPVFWSTWWRWGPHDGFFNSMDRFYGPIGWNTSGNALYNHNTMHGADVLAEIAPETEMEKRRVMHKSYSLDMFDERPMEWLVPSGQGTLHAELQELGVDTVVQVGAWTDDCIISTAFHAFSLQYDVVLIEDGVSTASKQHFNAIEVMRGALAKVLFAADVADYIRKGLPVVDPATKPVRTKLAGARSGIAHGLAQFPVQSKLQVESTQLVSDAGIGGSMAGLLNSALLVVFGPFCFAAGWLLRGRDNPRPHSADFLTLG